MAHDSGGGNLPCNGDGLCMVCDTNPPEAEILCCKTCVSPWHAACLSTPLETLAGAVDWECPDCSSLHVDHDIPLATTGQPSSANPLLASIRAIESDKSLTARQKAKKRQDIMSGRLGSSSIDEDESDNETMNEDNKSLTNLLDQRLTCSICMQTLERPVTNLCGHNFCLKCFQKWVRLGKRTCANCRSEIPSKIASNPRINSVLVVAIRMAKVSTIPLGVGATNAYHFVHNQDRPEKAYTTARAKKAGKANACSGKIFVTVPPDYFGPILAKNDPERKQGILVGETWEDRMECRQWGAHLPHVAGIAGQADYGAQSVALSGGYIDDEDHGEWFLYTGSGGRDLSGNKRTSTTQSFDQKFEKLNGALRISCQKGYPVRVVRSHKEKRSSYPPEKGVRYDGIYRIEKCWRKTGVQGFKVCRYLFVRCDNVPAPWTSDEHGDRPRPLPAVKELKKAIDVIERTELPSWDYDEEKGCWMWKKPPPESRRVHDGRTYEITKTKRRTRDTLKEFNCKICQKVMVLPLTTPCAHNFCKVCLEGAFTGQAFIKERTCNGRRTLRSQKTIMKCPSCPFDISEFLQNPQVNRELMGVIESLQHKSKEVSEDDNDPRAEETNAGGAKRKMKKVSEDAKSKEVSEDDNDPTEEEANAGGAKKKLRKVSEDAKEASGGAKKKTRKVSEDAKEASGGAKKKRMRKVSEDAKEASGGAKKKRMRKVSKDAKEASGGAKKKTRKVSEDAKEASGGAKKKSRKFSEDAKEASGGAKKKMRKVSEDAKEASDTILSS